MSGGYRPILEPLGDSSHVRGGRSRVGHAWADYGEYTACRQRIEGDGWLVRAVSWATDQSIEYVRGPACIIALESR